MTLAANPTFPAKRVATQRRNLQDYCNLVEDFEFAYSPSTGAVGIRNYEGDTFRVFNEGYPMYGNSEQVKDWVSVGCSRAIGERGPRRFHA